MAYLTSQPVQTVPIVGASSVEQLEETIAASAITLSQDELNRLKAG